MRIHPYDLPGLGMLAVDSVLGVTDLVESLHSRIAGVPAGQRLNGIPGLVYRNIRGVTGLLGLANGALARLAPVLEAHHSTPERDGLIAALNGVLGDTLHTTGNPLALTMSLRCNGQALRLDAPGLAGAVPAPGRKLLVVVHGLCMNDLHWSSLGHDFGAGLQQDQGFTPVCLRYNSGLHISTNGHAFAQLLEDLVRFWPAPVEDLVILAHSMGGLVTRSALQSAQINRLSWPGVLKKVVFLGTPHHGSPLERGGAWLQAALGASGYTAPFARLGRIRSAGVTDMRYGSLADEDWIDRDRFERSHDPRQPAPLPEGVACYAIGAVLRKGCSHPACKAIGDGLVPLSSALGEHLDPRLALDFPEDRRWVAHSTSHIDLIRKPEVYERVRRWLAEPA